MEQRSQEWQLARLGKLTASEIHVLMNDRTEKMTDEELVAFKAANPKSRVSTKKVPFNDSTFAYLNRKVMENYLPVNSSNQEAVNAVDEYIEQHSYSSRATDHGVFWEDTARSLYAEKMGYEVLQVGFVPYEKYPNLVGCSPDGMIRQENGGLECKCPFTLEKHLKHFLYTSAEELREEEPEYYWQCVMGMLDTGCTFWDFVSYNPYISKSKQMKILRIDRNSDDINLLADRIDLAVDYMKKKFEEIEQAQIIIK
ncbi:lambda exonuclease family protein [Prevotella sp. E2-28]|uniref:lambda exonuclease family protein n=1 Tax=Prevotella sp. E2-28 TaxID=2913620 RepID=UPI001EDB6CEE|nr:lambda exonuclease family protein [Prevotella sp. E2-28]UKK52634.1 YqaJ viral recombinase family protein [Prevotella sp. E2-28]